MQFATRIGTGMLMGLVATALAGSGRAQCELERIAPILDAQDAFGWSASISGDWLFVGAIGDDDFFSASGAAYIYQRQPNGTWLNTQKVTASDPILDGQFGNCVSVDGDTAMVTSHQNVDGAAYVFERSGTTWSETQKLQAPGGMPQHHFGHSAAISGDTILVGRMRDDHAGFESGSAHIFDKSVGSWVHITKLTGSDSGMGDRFGRSVSIDGDYAMVAAHKHLMESGKVYVYERDDNGTPSNPTDDNWPEINKLFASDLAVGDHFGRSLSVDGDTVLIGASEDFVASGVQSGSAYVFERLAGIWTQTAKLVPSDGANGDQFGEVVFLRGDTALIGAPHVDDVGSQSGAMYIFKRTPAGWVESSKVYPSDPTGGDEFGDEVSISMVGETVLVSSWGNSTAASLAGAAYVFRIPVSYCTGKTNTQGCVPEVSYTGIASASDPNPFNIAASLILNNKNGIFFYGTSGAASIPFQGGTLCVGAPVTRTPVQFSNGNPPPDDCSGTFSFDLNALIQSGTNPALVGGAIVNGQYWYRDPADLVSGSGLSNGVEVYICP